MIAAIAAPLRLVALLLLALLLGGCSAVRIGYDRAPEIAYWWLDGFLDFDPAQAPQVRDALAKLHDWHRVAELPAYAATLAMLQDMASGDVTAEQVCGVGAGLKVRLQALAGQVVPDVARLAPTLTAEQLEHLARQLAKRRQKWSDEWLAGTSAERQARRVKWLVERAGRFYGRLDAAQLVLLRTHVATSAFDAGISLREAERRHEDTLRTLRALRAGDPGAAPPGEVVRAWIERALDSPDPAYRRHAEGMTLEACALVARLHNSSTQAQRLKAGEVLKSYAEDLQALRRPQS